MSLDRKSALILFAAIFISGCASYAKGISSDGQKVYFGPVPIEKTEAFQIYMRSNRTEVDKQRYIFQRLRSATDLQFLHDGVFYNSLEAYRGGMWLMRHYYQKGQDSREFIRKYAERSSAGNVHLVKYPDGTMQGGAYILYNELDLLEAAAARQAPDFKARPDDGKGALS